MTMVLEHAVEFRRTFDALPDVLIQDAVRACAYMIPAGELAKYETTTETWTKVDESTVTFVIPDDALVEEVPPFLREPASEPSVLVQYRRRRTAYFLTFEQLSAHRVDQPKQIPDSPSIVTFIIPFGLELIEELPAIRAALLQSGQGSGPGSGHRRSPGEKALG